MNGTSYTMFPGANAGVAYSCVAGSCVPFYVNPAVEQLTGYRAEEFSACPQLWLKLIVTEDRQRVIEGLARLMADGKLDLEYRIVHAAGGLRHVRSAAQVVRGTRGRPARIDGVMAEIAPPAGPALMSAPGAGSSHCGPGRLRRRAEDIPSYQQAAPVRRAAFANNQTVPTDGARRMRLEWVQERTCSRATPG